MWSVRLLRPALAAVALLLSSGEGAIAEGFRVDSQVFIGKETTPHSTNITLFQAAHVYDFLDRPRQITIYDLARGRVVLVNPERKVKAELSQAMLEAFLDNLRRSEKQSADAVLRFALNPRFDEQIEENDGQRVFASKHITYRIKPLADSPAGPADAYGKFSDASARLNAFVNRGSLPPVPRLMVNQSLAKSGHVPAEVLLTVSAGRLGVGRTVVLKSKHEYRWRLLESDLQMINEAGEVLANAGLVPLAEYLRHGPQSDAAQARNTDGHR
jgi:hypothetical protein